MVRLKFLLIPIVVVVLSCNAQTESRNLSEPSNLWPDASLDKMIQTEQYVKALDYLKTQVSRKKMNDYTAWNYEFKILFLKNDSTALDDFVDRLVQAKFPPENMPPFLYGLRIRNRKNSYDKLFDREQKLLQDQLKKTNCDSCMIFFGIELTKHFDDSLYISAQSSMDTFCTRVPSREIVSEFLLSEKNVGKFYDELFHDLLSKDSLWSENLAPLKKVPK